MKMLVGFVGMLLVPMITGPLYGMSPIVDKLGNQKAEVSKVVESAVTKVLEVLKDEALDRDQKQETVMEIVEPLIDFELLAKLSLGKTHWGKIDENQRTSFTDLFVETLRLSYFEKLELFSDEIVEFGEPTPIKTRGSPKFQIESHIVSKGDRIQVSYMLATRDDAWKVFDLEIEGVSIRKSYGGQYHDFLRENSFDELLVQMRDKIDQKKRAADERSAATGE